MTITTGSPVAPAGLPSGTSAPAAAPETPAAQPAPAAAAPSPQPEDPDFARKFAALSRKEKEILKRELEVKKLTSDPSYKEYEAWRQLKANPRLNATEIVKSLGVDLSDFYKDLTGQVLNEGKPTLEQQVEMLQKQIEDDKKARENEKSSESKRRDDELVQAYQKNLFEVTESEPDEFEVMRAYADEGSYQFAFNVALQFLETNGVIPNPRDICLEVEKYYTDRANKLRQLKKLGLGNSPTETPSAPETTPPPQQVAAQSKTLTNSASSFAAAAATPSAPDTSDNPMDPEVRRRWTAERLRRQREEAAKNS